MRDWSRSWTSHAAGACALVLIASAAGHAQLSIAEINPTRSTFDATDPDGASGGRVNGLGRVVRPLKDQVGIIDRVLSNPALNHVYVDISWDETAKYILSSPETIAATADLINRHPDRFLFGTDEVAPADQTAHLKVYRMYAPLFARLTAAASEQVRKGNYERLFDEARRRVRAWEAANTQGTR